MTDQFQRRGEPKTLAAGDPKTLAREGEFYTAAEACQGDSEVNRTKVGLRG